MSPRVLVDDTQVATVNDNDDLADRSKLLMVRMCGVIIPRQFINPFLDELFTAIQTFPVSTRMKSSLDAR